MKRCIRHLLRGCAAALIVFACRPADASAGWIVEQVDSDLPGDPIVYYLQDHKAKVTGYVPGLDFIVDLSRNYGMIIDEKEQKFAGGTVEVIAQVLERSERRKRAVPGDDDPGGARPRVVMERVEKIESVAGFAAEHYRFTLDGELVEEVWLTHSLGPVSGVGGESLFSILDAMTGGSRDRVERTGLEDLLQAGFPLRRKTYFIGEELLVDTVRISREALPASTFDVPAGFADVDYAPLFFGEE